MIKENIQKYIPENFQAEFYDNAAAFEISISQIKNVVSDFYKDESLSLKLVTATDEREENGCFKIWYIFGMPSENAFIVPYIKLENTTEFPSLALTIPQISGYERKIQTFFGLTPIGHHDERPIILHENWPTNIFPLRKDFKLHEKPEDAKGIYKFQKVGGEGIYEVPVGPIHAGIIEPGHFRFSLAGESIVNLEPKLGYVHKGSEKLFEILALADKVRLSEKISGDSSFSHSLAFCQALEHLSNIIVPKRALYLRVIYAELERLANHFGDIGAIMTDTGFNFGGANGARLREIIMQINEKLTSSRFLRGVNAIGGVTKNINHKERSGLLIDLTNILKDFSEVITIAEDSTSLLNRLKGTGIISNKIAKICGVTGVAGKASGILKDVRRDYPYSGYTEITIANIANEQDGDVYARFNVRIKEVRSSIDLIQKALHKLPEGEIKSSVIKGTFKKSAIAISIVEGWRGEIVYFITTDKAGNISRVVSSDPSFINWTALKNAGLNNILPDFPLINKSFNLSYSGNDL